MVTKQKNRLLFKIAETRKNCICFLIFGILSILAMVIIFLFSAQKAEDSAALSVEFGSFIEKMLNGMDWLFGESLLLWIKTYLRKIAHFVLYTLLGAFTMATVTNTKIKKVAVKITVAAGVGLAYSISDEIHQLFVEGRSGEVRDILLDFAGVITGILFTLAICKIIQIIAKNLKKI